MQKMNFVVIYKIIFIYAIIEVIYAKNEFYLCRKYSFKSHFFFSKVIGILDFMGFGE